MSLERIEFDPIKQTVNGDSREEEIDNFVSSLEACIDVGIEITFSFSIYWRITGLNNTQIVSSKLATYISSPCLWTIMPQLSKLIQLIFWICSDMTDAISHYSSKISSKFLYHKSNSSLIQFPTSFIFS